MRSSLKKSTGSGAFALLITLADDRGSQNGADDFDLTIVAVGSARSLLAAWLL